MVNSSLAEGAEQLIVVVKAGQRSNQDVKKRWAQYCMQSCDGTKDPAKHSQESLTLFLQMIESDFGKDSWYQYPDKVPSRSNYVSHQVGAHVDPAKSHLVTLIKAGQLQSPEWTIEWAEYAANHLNSVMDPSAHNVATLQGFVDATTSKYEKESWFMNPEKFASAPRRNSGVSSFSGQTMLDAVHCFNSHGAWNGKEQWMHADPSMPAHPELVHMIKEKQRGDPHFKESWGQFCDSYCEGIRDPCRHPGANVIQFLEMHGHLPKGGFLKHFGGSNANGGDVVSIA